MAKASREPLVAGRRRLNQHVSVCLFILIPFAALTVAVPFAWGWGLSWFDALLALGWYSVTMVGVTVGYHRYFTHRSFKAGRPVKVALAVMGSLAAHGPIINWVATHRRHHVFADRDGDPHSPWGFGTSPLGLLRGFWHAHLGWILDRDLTNQRRFAADLLQDRDIVRVHHAFFPLTAITLFGPGVLGGLVSGTWSGAITTFFWAGLVRIALLHHVTWSVNSICHIWGNRPEETPDRSTNAWPLALLSFGESWHNYHHAHPASARHGVGRGHIDISARLIWAMELCGLAYDVRWPKPDRNP